MAELKFRNPTQWTSEVDWKTLEWDARGQPYHPVQGGQRFYLSPYEATNYTRAPDGTFSPQDYARLAQWAQQRGVTDDNVWGDATPSHGFLHDTNWNPATGDLEQTFNKGSLLTLGTGALLAAPAVGALLPGGAAASGSAAGATAGGAGLPAAATAGMIPMSTAVGSTAAGGGIGAALKGLAKTLIPNSTKDVATLAALGTMLAGGRGGGSSPFSGDLGGEADRMLQLQRQRVEQAQPVYDTLVNMAYGMSPTRYRGAPPAGTPASASEAPSGAYQYQAPRFR